MEETQLSRRTLISRRTGLSVVLVLAGTLVAACGAPGGSAGSGNASATAVTSPPTCGGAPVTMRGYFETGFPMPKALTDEFSKEYPNVTWDVREDQFAVITQNAPRVLADDPPDLMRLPQVSDLVKDGLLKNLDGYAQWFGWDKWPSGQLAPLRMGPGGHPRGEGSLYAMGLNFSTTGIFYNKQLAARIGMSSPPQTLAELDDALAKAKNAGIQPIQHFNGGATGGLVSRCRI
jgi:raffinose/stachyose/melibiose transport system substrate-binding protein